MAVRAIIDVMKKSLLVGAVVMAGFVHAGEVNLYAAASLTDALTELTKHYQQLHPDTHIKTSFAGSSTLAKQIENGAPAELFISADDEWMDYLQTRNLLDAASRVELLTNELVLIAPVNHTPAITLDKNTNLASRFTGKLCTGEPAHVPVGKYAKQALQYFGWWDSIRLRLVGTEDVRTALAFVERGECSLGIVYKTDAQLSKKITRVASFPPESHLPIVYPGGLTKNAAPDAQEFWKFLQSKPALDVFARYGFGVIH